jgi:hypothetical protein
MFKMMCPKCFEYNYTAFPEGKSKCVRCEFSFSLDDVLREVSKINNSNRPKNNAWISNECD